MNALLSRLKTSAPGNPQGPAARAAFGVRSFAIATLGPLAFLILGAFFGGIVAWGAFVTLAILFPLADRLIATAAPDAPKGTKFPAADRLSATLAIAHFAALGLALFALTGGTGLSGWDRVAVFLGFGLFFGQVSNSNAHELIHRSNRLLFRLGKWVYISLLFGHHTSAHRLVHHRFVASPDDPNSAQLGEGFWDFAARAWPGSFVAGFEMEQNLRTTRPPAQGIGAQIRAMNPYYSYILGGAGFIAAAMAVFGLGGLLAYLLLCAHAQLQILLADYVQHYGLSRRQLALDRLEPVGPQHSWDAPHPVSSLWMLNAPRHSDHHAHPTRAYPALRLGDAGDSARPLLPRSLPVMAAIAMVPPLWRRMMDRRVAAVTGGR